jgi:S1-C subfamily serine protease
VPFLLATALFALLAVAAPLPARADGPVEPSAVNRLTQYAKPAVVKIWAGYSATYVFRNHNWSVSDVGTGSGSFINPDGYVLTNAHVVSSIHEGQDAALKTLNRKFLIKVMRAYGVSMNDDGMSAVIKVVNKEGFTTGPLKRWAFVELQSGKELPYEIKSYGAPSGEGKDLQTGKDVAVIKVEVKNAPTLKLGNSSTAQVGDHIWVIGYPGAADSDLLDTKSELEPTTNDGSISAKKTSKDGAPILQTNTNTTHGNSGGPAINENGEVIGLLTFRGDTVNDQEVQGFNFLVAIDTAKEFVRSAGTENKSSPVDELWRSGLEHYWKRHCTAAQKDFQQTLDLFPEHAPAQALKIECAQCIAKGEDRSTFPFGLVLGLLGVVVVGGGAAAAIVLMKKPGQPGVGAPVGYAQRPAYGVAPGPNAPTQAPYGAPPQQAYGAPPGPGYGPPPGAPGGYAPPTHPQPAYGAPPGQYGAPPTGQMGAAPPPGLGMEAFAATAYAPGPGPTGRPKGPTEVFTPPPNATLVCTSGPLMGRPFPVGAGVLIGREDGAQIVVNDAQVSGKHVWVGFLGTRLVARDMGSTNATFVNGNMSERIREIELRPGDELTLGGNGTIRFRLA